LYSPRANNDVNALLFRLFNRHCIDRRHLLGDGGNSSYLIEFADYRLDAMPPEAMEPTGKSAV
jgi:hypothetical protein